MTIWKGFQYFLCHFPMLQGHVCMIWLSGYTILPVEGVTHNATTSVLGAVVVHKITWWRKITLVSNTVRNWCTHNANSGNTWVRKVLINQYRILGHTRAMCSPIISPMQRIHHMLENECSLPTKFLILCTKNANNIQLWLLLSWVLWHLLQFSYHFRIIKSRDEIGMGCTKLLICLKCRTCLSGWLHGVQQLCPHNI